jgi:serine/threonine-protein kinase
VEAGRRIGKYVLAERIAVGGMAEVWAARVEGREGFVKQVALKFILESFSGDPEVERLFVNEARIAARLQHANLVAVFDFDKVAADDGRGRYYIAMERVEGQDLRRILEAARRAGCVFPVVNALYVAGEVLKALRYVHERREGGVSLGLVHRDVSPHNVLVDYAGEVKLSDFGIAKAREHSARSTKPGSLRGKIAYSAPEQLAGGTVDHRLDQFAAGVTIWEMLAGRKLFDGDSDLEIIGRVARCEIPALAALGRGDVPADVEAVLRRMLAPEPGGRFRTTAEALAAVLSLPGYTPDGAGLGELVRALFTSSGVGLSHTVPLRLVDAARAAGGPTRTMDEAPAGPVVGVVAPVAAQTPTRVAKRTTEALARSTAASPDGTTTELRARSGARLAVALALVAGGALALRPPSRRVDAPSPRGPAPSAAAPAARADTGPSPAAIPRRPAPAPSAGAVSPVAAPASAAVADVEPVPGEPSRPARAAAERRRAARRVATLPRAAAAPAPEPARSAEPSAKEGAPKSSANGAPIIE